MTTLSMRPTLPKRAYKLRCRFKIEPHQAESRLGREKVRIAERFVKDMHAQGWENEPSYGFLMRGPLPMVTPVTIRPRRVPTAREMRAGVARGERFLDTGEDTARLMPTLAMSEWWEYEIVGIFVRPQIMTEYADRHEEQF